MNSKIPLSILLATGLLLVSVSWAAEKKENISPLANITVQRGAKPKAAGWIKSFDCGAGSPEMERVHLDPKDKVSIRLRFQKATGNMPAQISAEDGGVINGKSGSVTISSLGTPEIEFAVGGQRGRYTLRIEQGDQLQLIEFWVGEEPPTGKAGPKLTFKGE